MWSLGDYSLVSPLLEPAARSLATACPIGRGTTVLDVAAGDGNFALAAARLGGAVTACDFSPRMVELGRARSAADRIDVEWRAGDAESLPFDDRSFDVVVSVFGAMFAPRPDHVAHEMFRVCRGGGTVAMANYSWPGFLGDYARLLARYSNPSPVRLPSPFEWGDPAVVKQRFDGLCSSLETREETLTFTAGFELWERTNAPTIALRQTLAVERYDEFRHEAESLMTGELVSSYLVVIAKR